MDQNENIKNSFLLDLLALQQDGKQAISAPTNWTQEPLLDVETDVDEVVNELIETILIEGSGNDTARWHFLIGSPGNGKSAAMGKLCRKLRSSKRCQVLDENGVSITDLAPTVIPYAIDVYEEGNKFATAQIVQDASVVRNPFSPDVDPATELLHTLKSSWEKGISLIVCTNRGVLEKTHRDNQTIKDINTTPWFKILSAIVSVDNTDTTLLRKIGEPRNFIEKKTVFSKVQISYSHLDNRSLLLGQDTFETLVKKATNSEHWSACAKCPAQQMCPFKANRDWLVDDEARSRVLQLLRRAEVLSGQIIVFREALAIISLILVGCPSDYGSKQPCEWVQELVSNNDVFSLAVRRIYMSLFVSHAPHGLETVETLRKPQIEALQWLCDVMNKENQESFEAMEHVMNLRAPSVDVGVTRHLGSKGIIANLDPCREALPADFYERWDSGFEALGGAEGPMFTGIEIACVSIWQELERCLELETKHSVSEAHWALRRWSSNFILHFGALLEGRSAWSKELDDFAELLGLVATPAKSRSVEQKRSIRQLDNQIEILLNMVAGNQGESAVQLSEAVALSGKWVREKLKPATIASEGSGSVSLAIEFQGGEKTVFAAPMYLWLKLRAAGRLDLRCFPQELLSGATDARVRAASKSKYAFENNDIELVVETGKGETLRLSRFDGEVDVSDE